MFSSFRRCVVRIVRPRMAGRRGATFPLRGAPLASRLRRDDRGHQRDDCKGGAEAAEREAAFVERLRQRVARRRAKAGPRTRAALEAGSRA